MSKEKPEVGDVWLNTETNIKFAVIGLILSSSDYVLYNEETNNIMLVDRLATMPKQYIYLGKSKCNIKELFDVKD